MSAIGFLFLQLAPAQGAPLPPPDIELNARVQAREVEIRQDGAARVALRAEPGDAPPVRVERSAPAGAKKYRNLTIDVEAEARLVNPPQTPSQQGTIDEPDGP
jgi:hypothetical protein